VTEEISLFPMVKVVKTGAVMVDKEAVDPDWFS
jgi:hypothetical protein